MSITAAKGFIPEKYIPESQKNETPPAEFTLKPLTGLEYMEVMSEMYRDDKGQIHMPGTALTLAINYGLKGWKNFIDEDGEDVGFSKQAIAFLPAVELSELADKIIAISELGVAERKNLS